MKTSDIFADLGEFQQYSDGMIADTSLDELLPSIRTVSHDIISIITADVYIAIRQGDDEEALELLKTAIASGASEKYQIFATTKKNGSEASMYKYQHEEMKAHHAESFWTAMDRLLDWLDDNKDFGSWKESSEYKQRQELPVRNAAEFDYYYGIGKSAFFYHKVLFLIRQIWTQDILPALLSEPSDKIMELAKQALCYQVMARAVMQFDITELPRSIHFDNSHEFSKDSGVQQRTSLYNQLMAKVNTLLASIERLKSAGNNTAGMSNGQKEENKYYSML